MSDDTNTCPAARLAREAAQIIEALGHVEEKPIPARTSADDDEVLRDRLEAIETEASYVRASSPLGSFYQALLVYGELDEQCVWVSKAPNASHHTRLVIRRLRRLMDSIAGRLEPDGDSEANAVRRSLRSYYPNLMHGELATFERLIAYAPRAAATSPSFEAATEKAAAV